MDNCRQLARRRPADCSAVAIGMWAEQLGYGVDKAFRRPLRSKVVKTLRDWNTSRHGFSLATPSLRST